MPGYVSERARQLILDAFFGTVPNAAVSVALVDARHVLIHSPIIPGYHWLSWPLQPDDWMNIADWQNLSDLPVLEPSPERYGLALLHDDDGTILAWSGATALHVEGDVYDLDLKAD